LRIRTTRTKISEFMGDSGHGYDAGSVAGKLLRGDPDALGLVIRWAALVLTAPRFWSLRRDWKDLHQEVMRRILVSLRRGRFDPSRDLRAYVQSVARYTALEACQGQREGTPEWGVGRSENPTAHEGDAALRRVLARSVMDRVSDDCRGMFKLFYYEGRTYGEIAAAMDVPVGTVKSRLFRCLESAHRLIVPRRRKLPEKELP